ncbi:MAG: hypothetical protein DMD58_09760 [Gemmatimonadetes bacterium]|nr:MAG: hypothetical protein DMD58_09760 [Gemmatimonadota bacterium]
MQPVAAAADMRQDERDVRVTARERAQLARVGRFLARPVMAAVLPDVLQHRHAALPGQSGNRIEQRVIGPAARRQLDSDHPCVEAAHDLGAGVRAIVRIHADVAANAVGVGALQGQQGIVPGCDIAGRGEIGRGREAETAQDRGHMHRNTDLGARCDPALIALAPVGPGRPLVVKMSVDVDKHCHNLRPFYLGGFLSGEIGMETTVGRARGVLFEPRATFKEVDSEFTKPGAIWGRYILPLALLGPLAGAVGRLVFGKRIAGMSLPESLSITGAITWFGISLVLQLAAVFALTQIISLLAPGFGGQKNDVQALKVAAYASTPMWVAGIFNIHGRFLMVGIIISLYSLYLLYVGLPTLMKVPQDRSMGYTAVVIIAAIVVFLLVSTYTLF